jgi:hypothetical protein
MANPINPVDISIYDVISLFEKLNSNQFVLSDNKKEISIKDSNYTNPDFESTATNIKINGVNYWNIWNLGQNLKGIGHMRIVKKLH